MSLEAAPALARIPAGDFLMGAADAEDDERPVHRVYVSEFFIGRFAVTQDEYARFVRATGHPPPAVRALPLIAGRRPRHRVQRGWPRRTSGPTASRPPASGATRSSSSDMRTRPPIARGCPRRSAAWPACRLKPNGKRRRAEVWRGLRYPWGDDCDLSRCNFLVDASTKHLHGTRPTGTYPPNPYGLHDMSGNVWEWVSDWYGSDYYASSEQRDPRGPASGTTRIVRGGSWVNEDVAMLRCAYRHKTPSDTYVYSIGFRIVCTD